jgi:hypothetical protein
MVYTVNEVAEMMDFHRDTITYLFEKEPGIIIINSTEKLHKRRYRSLGFHGLFMSASSLN